MLGIENLSTFIGTGIILGITPGPDTLYIIGRSVYQGRLAGITSVLGVSSGMLIHTLVGVFGLSAILTTSSMAFTLIKYVGAAYLFYLGIKMYFVIVKEKDVEQKNKKYRLRKIYQQGTITNILNPKAAVFFLAFIPQFISEDSSNKLLAFIALGLLLILIETIWYLILAAFSAQVSKPLRKNTFWSKWLNRINSVLFLYLGIRLVILKFE